MDPDSIFLITMITLRFACSARTQLVKAMIYKFLVSCPHQDAKSMRAGGYYLLLTKILLFIGHYTTDIISSAASSMNIIKGTC